MQIFQVQSYSVWQDIERLGNPVETRRNRFITLKGGAITATLIFSTRWDTWTGTPRVGFESNPNSVTGWLPSSEYSYWYDLLRAEKPMYLLYEVTPLGGANYISKFALSTTNEPPGEGPADMTP